MGRLSLSLRPHNRAEKKNGVLENLRMVAAVRASVVRNGELCVGKLEKGRGVSEIHIPLQPGRPRVTERRGCRVFFRARSTLLCTVVSQVHASSELVRVRSFCIQRSLALYLPRDKCSTWRSADSVLRLFATSR